MKVFIIALFSLGLQAFAAEPIRFLAIDVFIDPKGEPLAAYQLEIAADAGTKIVGVEGGEHPEFRKAPYYDPKAMQSERIIVAAFSAAAIESLPNSKTRILTLHVQTMGSPNLKTVLKVAARSDRQKVDAAVSLIERKAE